MRTGGSVRQMQGSVAAPKRRTAGMVVSKPSGSPETVSSPASVCSKGNDWLV